MQRLKTLQKQIPNTTAYLLSDPGDITYFTEFQFLVPSEREALLLVTKKSATLLHASFSPVASPPDINRVAGCNPEKLKTQLLTTMQEENITSLAIDKNTLFVAEYEVLEQLDAVTISGLDRNKIWQLRSVKSAAEISHIRQAAKITKKALTQTIEALKPGISELEVKNLLEETAKKLGSGPLAFPTIVAFGKHTALPHHQPTEQTLKDNMPVLIDVGATYFGYCADMTRTIWFGDTPDVTYIEIESIITDAYVSAMQKLQTVTTVGTLTAKDVDAASRTVIAKKGYSKQFVHTTGHGVGLNIHEQPSLSWINETALKPNMIVTIEPGIYVSGLFGIRYENTVLIGEEIEELTK